MLNTSYNMKLSQHILLMYFCGIMLCQVDSSRTTHKPFVLSLIHFSDFHARFVEVSPSGGLCYEQDKDKCVGGIARIATIVKCLKQLRPNPIFLDAGDSFQGTLYYDLFKGNITAHFINELHPDVHSIGNHDFDDGVSGFVSYVKRLNSPVVVTNIDYTDEPLMQNLYTNSTILRRGNKNIGIIGAIDPDTGKKSFTTGKLKFLNEVETINLEAKKLKARGIDIIIVLSHCGLKHDKIIASSCPDVDVIVGGHSHILLYNGIPPSNDIALGRYPLVVVQRENNRKVLIVHAGAFTKYVGDLQVTFDENGEVSTWKGHPIYLDKTIQEDPSFIAMLKPWKVEHDRIGKRFIGQTLTYLNGTCNSGECNLANLITDAMVDYYANEASIGFVTSDSIQNSIPVGPIFYEDIYTALPYNNTWNWILIELKASDLLQVLEENVAKSSSNTSFANEKLIQWSGLKVVYNLTNEQSKSFDVKVRCLRCDEGKFEKLNNDDWYRIVVSPYLLTQRFKTISTKYRLIKNPEKFEGIENVVDYIEKKRVINVATESRMVFVR